jgi:hypothetical protein
MRQHGKGKRRVWRKLRLMVDTRAGEILAHALTGSDHHDAPERPGLLDKVEGQVEGQVEVVTADKGYDSFANHRAILVRGQGPSSRRAPGLPSPPITRRRTRPQPAAMPSAVSARSAPPPGRPRPAIPGRHRDTHITDADMAISCINTFTAIGMPNTVKIA